MEEDVDLRHLSTSKQRGSNVNGRITSTPHTCAHTHIYQYSNVIAFSSLHSYVHHDIKLSNNSS
jgi:hypothetical protein